MKRTVCWGYDCCSLFERGGGFCLGVSYRSLLNDTLVYVVVSVGFLDSTPYVHVNGSEEYDDDLEVSSLEWWMMLCNHHVILEEEANSNDQDGSALNHLTSFCLLLLSLLDNDVVVTKTVVET
jgi:hypothetical protein